MIFVFLKRPWPAKFEISYFMLRLDRENLNSLRPTLNMDYLNQKLRDFGSTYGFIPKAKEDVTDDFGYVDPEIRELAYEAKQEIENYYARTESVIPFHWHKVRLYRSRLPCRLEYVVDLGRKVLKSIKGVLGQYVKGCRNIYINDSLWELENGRDTLKYALKHELFHSIQDELDSISREPQWKVEAEASMFAVDGFEYADFERMDNGFAYRDWTLNYIRRWGRRLMTSFKKKLRQVHEYFSPWELSAMGLEPGEE
jgi:hypothetical protein